MWNPNEFHFRIPGCDTHVGSKNMSKLFFCWPSDCSNLREDQFHMVVFQVSICLGDCYVIWSKFIWSVHRLSHPFMYIYIHILNYIIIYIYICIYEDVFRNSRFNQMFIAVFFLLTCISGWWFQPSWKILVSWDDYSQYMEKTCSKPPTKYGSVW